MQLIGLEPISCVWFFLTNRSTNNHSKFGWHHCPLSGQQSHVHGAGVLPPSFTCPLVETEWYQYQSFRFTLCNGRSSHFRQYFNLQPHNPQCQVCTIIQLYIHLSPYDTKISLSFMQHKTMMIFSTFFSEQHNGILQFTARLGNSANSTGTFLIIPCKWAIISKWITISLFVNWICVEWGAHESWSVFCSYRWSPMVSPPLPLLIALIVPCGPHTVNSILQYNYSHKQALQKISSQNLSVE